MARNWRWWYTLPKPYTVQPVCYFYQDSTVPFEEVERISDMLEALSDFTRDDLGGYTFRHEEPIVHRGTQLNSQTHFQNALWEVPKVDPCSKREVFMLFMMGRPNQPVGAVGPEYWECTNTIPPGRVLAFWNGGPFDVDPNYGPNSNKTYGAMLHELGHCFSLSHPLSPQDPRASGPNIMGSGWSHFSWPRGPQAEGFHPLDRAFLRTSPWFKRR